MCKADLAERKCKQRHREKPKIVRFTTAIKHFVDTLLKQDYSPNQIVGTANKLGVLCVSIERIYQYIWYDKHKLGTLYTHLRSKGKNTEKEGLQKTRPTSKNGIGLTYELLSVDSFTEKLLCLCKDDLLREQIGISGRELLEREYTADIVYDKLIQYLEKQVKIDRKHENYTRLVKTSF